MVMRAEWGGGQEISPGLDVEGGVPRLTKQQEWGGRRVGQSKAESLEEWVQLL